jgi:hypothetical protein
MGRGQKFLTKQVCTSSRLHVFKASARLGESLILRNSLVREAQE